MHLSFGEFQLDTELFELRQNGRLCELEPKVFDLLAYFVQHPGQLFTHEELIEQVWKGRIVSDSTVSTCIKNARKALGDSGGNQHYIKTVRGRGYRFSADVTNAAPSASSSASRLAASTTSLTPALLIFPFRPLSGGTEAIQLTEALANDLGTILTRVPLLRLSLQPRPHDNRGVTPTARAMHERFGVDYLLDGTLQEVGGKYRINAHLADGKSGFQLWGEQFVIPGRLAEALEQVSITVIAKLEPQLHRAIYASVRSTTGESNARQLFLEASGVMALKGWRHDAFMEAADLLRRSRERDPEFALAHSFLSLVMGFGDRVGLISNREQAKAEALESAERALELDGMDSTVLGYSGCALADIGYIDRALPILRNAVDINPANAQAWVALGSVCLLQRQLEEGIEHLKHGIAISPLDSRLSIWGALLTVGLLQAGKLGEALVQGELACRRDDRCYLPRVALASVHVVRDDRGNAMKTLADAYRIKPDLSPLQINSIVGRKLGSVLQRMHRSRSQAS